MTPNVEKALQGAAASAVVLWGLDLDPEVGAAPDLVQDLWVWYLERPSVQAQFAEADMPLARYLAHEAANQLLAEQALQADVFQGRALYASEAVKDALKGRSTNRYLKDILPIAVDRLPDTYSEALRARYEDGAVPPQGAQQTLLRDAHRAATSEVNIIAITAGDVHRASAVMADTRKRKGAHGDPVGDLAVALATDGDNVIQTRDKEGNVTTSTVREEAYSILDDWLAPAHKPQGGPDSIMADQWNNAQRVDMYRAQAFPDLYPNEKPMLIHNWPQQDREEYCGGEFTVGRRHLAVVR